MKIIENTLDFQLNTPTVVAMGKFDGVHVGHSLLLEKAMKKRKDGLLVCVFTFDPSPAVLFGLSDGKELMTKTEKRAFFEKMGVDVLVEFPLSRETAATAPEYFVEEILVKRLCMKCVVAGTDVSFGAKGAGNLALLDRKGEECGFTVEAIDKVRMDDMEVSSSEIRRRLEDGDLAGVMRMLGRPYSIRGTVEHGKKLGRTLNMPTANIIPEAGKLLPQNGVYNTLVLCEGQTYPALSNIGCKPTVTQEKKIGIESFLFDFSKDIYGKEIEVFLIAFVRGEKAFSSVEELKAQMERDVAQAKQFCDGYAVSEIVSRM